MKRLFAFIAGVAVASGVYAASVHAQNEGSGTDATASVEQVQGRVESLGEQVSTMQSDVDKMKKFKFSGYLQARYEISELSQDKVTVDSKGSPKTLNNDRFYIRRARLKLTYDASTLTQGVVYFDAGADRAVTLLEAYLTLRDPWTVDHRHFVNIGQMNVPFGYELERSSSVRELPERSKAENVLFPGERDRGITFTSQWLPQLQTVFGFLNGGGVKHVDFPNTDPTRKKDFVARARWSQGIFDIAGSLYDGRNVTPLTDVSKETLKTRYGADAQYYYSLPTIGGGSLKAEFYTGHEVNPDSVKVLAPGRALASGANASHIATDFAGWYAMWVQNIGEKAQFAARYDTYDPNSDADHDQYDRINLGVNYFYDGNTRITVAYDVPTTDRKVTGSSPADYKDPKDNLWTIQFQHKF